MTALPLNDAQAQDTAGQILKLRADEQSRLRRISNYVGGHHTSVYVPKGARAEYRWLIKRAKVNVLPLVVTVVAQGLHVVGYRPANSDDNAAPWETWQANRMDARQHGIHRAALTYGASYTVVMPGKPHAVIRPVSPRRMTAVYDDDVDDEWPRFALESTILNTTKGAVHRAFLYDDTMRYELRGDGKAKKLEYVGAMAHDLGVCPVVRYVNAVDLDGELDVSGEVEPLIELQDQLNNTTFNLMMAQQYAAFRQRWATGMAVDIDPVTNQPIEPLKSAVDRLWTSTDANTKFGEFGQTDLSGYLDSRESTIRHMATISQTPPHYLLGQMINISAEALAAAESGLSRKKSERKSTFGESHEQTMRLAGKAEGNAAAWNDQSAQVVWDDDETRSFSATVDGWGKAVQMLGVPEEETWERLPGVTQTDAARWKVKATERQARDELTAALTQARTPAQAPQFRQPVGANGQPG